MATSVTVTKTNNAEIDGLLGGTKWTGTVTYSFPDSPTDYLSGYSTKNEPTTGFSQAPAAEQAAINYAVGLILSYTNASIQYAGTNSANIQIASSSAANPTAYAYYPSNSSTGTGGDVWFGNAYDFSQAKLGNYYFLTGLHELGHAFGLKHSQETGGVANVAVPSAHDDSEFTVMSYRSYVGGPLTGYTNEAYGYPQTYMANDILALQTLYGANFSTQSGNTTYSWNPATGQEFINGVGQPAPGGGAGGSANRVFMTVWDGGGNDTYDLSNYSTAVTINLNPGASSITSTTQLAYLGNGHYAQGNVFNAYLYNSDARSYIDNAIGGAGNDTLVGNPIGNTLLGGAGNDRITGGGGNDFINGGSGSDTAVFSGNLASYRISWDAAAQAFTVADQRTGTPDGTDIIVGVENFQFADGVFDSSLFTVAVNHAPVVTVADVKANPGQTLQASSLFTATDADNDALMYYFQDNSSAANSGHFVVNGTAIAAGTSFGVNAAQLAQTVFVAGTGASDDVLVQVTDGQANSNLAGFRININHAPVVTVADVSARPGQTLQASSLFGAVDPDNDTLTYYFEDLTPDSSFEDFAPAVNTGHFVVNGTVIAAGTSFGVSAAQLAQTVFVAGDPGTSDHLVMQVTDGRAVSNLAEFHVNADAVNHAPGLTVTDVSVSAGQTIQASNLFSATDSDNDTLRYYFYDNSPSASSGHFVVNGTAIAAGTSFGGTAAQLAQTVFVAGAGGTSDDIYVQVTDGYAVSTLGELHVNAINHAPVLTVANMTAAAGQTLQASSLFSATDADNDALRYYFYDNSPSANSGHFVVNGVAIAAGTSFGGNAAQLAQTVFVAGADGTFDDLLVQVTDGVAVSNLGEFRLSVNHAPVLTVASMTVGAGHTLQASSLFSATDADNDALMYYFQDNGTAANSGYFVVNGTPITAGTSFGVNAAQLAQTVFVTGAPGTSDHLVVQVTDGRAVSNLAEFDLNVVNHAPVLTVADVSASAGQIIQAASLFSATDADNDALMYYFQDDSRAANSGHFVVNGTAIAAGTSFGVTAAQLAQTVFVAGAGGTSDDIYVQLTDGYAVSSLGALHVNTVNHAPVLTVSDVSADAGLTVQASSLFSATDADNDALMYYFYDNSPAANSGHFVVNGTAIAAGTSFGVNAAQLAQTAFVTGAAGTSDDLLVQVTDGVAVSALGEFHLTAVTPVLGTGMFSGEAPDDDPSHDNFPGMAGNDIHFDAGGNSAFAFLPSLGAAGHGAADVAVPPVNQDLAAAAVASSDDAIHLDPFGHAIALHVVHPADTLLV